MIRQVYLKNIVFYSITLILLYYVYTLFHISSLISYIFKFLIPVLSGIFIHFITTPLINYFSKHIRRKTIVLFFYIFVLLIALIILYYIIPYMSDYTYQTYKRITQLSYPPAVNQAISLISQADFIKPTLAMITELTTSLFYYLKLFIIGIGISFYLSFDNIHLIDNLIGYLPEQYNQICLKRLSKIKKITYMFIKSIFIDFIIFFSLSFLLFLFINKESALLIALLLAITNLIPYIGPILGGLPIIVYHYIIDPQVGFISLILIIILQYAESSYIQPCLFYKTTKIHPIILILSLLFFSDILGIIGMIFSPLLSSYIYQFYILIKELKIYPLIKNKLSV